MRVDYNQEVVNDPILTIKNRLNYKIYLRYVFPFARQDFDHNGNEPIPIILVGNKCDLESKKVISYQCGKSVSSKVFFFRRISYYKRSLIQDK